jgi:hydroxymethylbilane synthase
MTLRLGARGSTLSLAQTEQVARLLAPFAEVEIRTFRTTGDRLSRLGAEISGKGVFTKEIDEALLEGRVDVGVHSLKDLPSAIPQGLALAAVPAREDARDVLLSRSGSTLARLPAGARVGTGSPRRRAQLLAARPDLEILEARGNVDTRIRRMREGRWDAIVLARAGLARLGRLEDICEVLPEEVMLPAIGQGALALVVRREDGRAAEIVRRLDDPASHRAVLAERALLTCLEAGCRAPLAGHARVRGEEAVLRAAVFSPDGDRLLREEGLGRAEDPERLGRQVGEKLLARGAAGLIAEARA